MSRNMGMLSMLRMLRMLSVVSVSRMLKEKRGAVSLYILVALLVVCLLLPVYMFTLEKLAARSNIDKIQDAITISATSAYMALMPEFYTDGEIRFDQVLFKSKLNKLLMDNLGGEYAGAEIIEEQIFWEGLPRQCYGGRVFSKPGVHIAVRVPIAFSAARLLLPIKSDQQLKMLVHGDVLFTVDN